MQRDFLPGLSDILRNFNVSNQYESKANEVKLKSSNQVAKDHYAKTFIEAYYQELTQLLVLPNKLLATEKPELKEIELAIENCNKFLEIHPDDERTINLRTKLYVKKGDKTNADAELKKLIGLKSAAKTNPKIIKYATSFNVPIEVASKVIQAKEMFETKNFNSAFMYFFEVYEKINNIEERNNIVRSMAESLNNLGKFELAYKTYYLLIEGVILDRFNQALTASFCTDPESLAHANELFHTLIVADIDDIFLSMKQREHLLDALTKHQPLGEEKLVTEEELLRRLKNSKTTPEEKIGIYSALIKMDPKIPHYYYERAKLNFDLNRLGDSFFVDHEESSQIYDKLGTCLSDCAIAIWILRGLQTTKKCPLPHHLFYGLKSQVFLKIGNFDKAVDWHNRLLDAPPNEETVYRDPQFELKSNLSFSKAIIAEAEKAIADEEYDDALAILKTSLQLAIADKRCAILMAQIYCRQRKHDEALNIYDTVLEQLTHFDQVKENKGLLKTFKDTLQDNIKELTKQKKLLTARIEEFSRPIVEPETTEPTKKEKPKKPLVSFPTHQPKRAYPKEETTNEEIAHRKKLAEEEEKQKEETLRLAKENEMKALEELKARAGKSSDKNKRKADKRKQKRKAQKETVATDEVVEEEVDMSPEVPDSPSEAGAGATIVSANFNPAVAPVKVAKEHKVEIGKAIPGPRIQILPFEQSLLKKLAENKIVGFVCGGKARAAAQGIMPDPNSDTDIIVTDQPQNVVRVFKKEYGDSVWEDKYIPGLSKLMTLNGFQLDLFSSKLLIESFAKNPNADKRTLLLPHAQNCDFTVGALFYGVDGQVHDPLGRGLADLAEKRLVTIKPAMESFEEGPIRMLRACNFAVKEQFTLSDEIKEAIKVKGILLTTKEKPDYVNSWLRKLLTNKQSAEKFSKLIETGLIDTLFAPFADELKQDRAWIEEELRRYETTTNLRYVYSIFMVSISNQIAKKTGTMPNLDFYHQNPLIKACFTNKFFNFKSITAGLQNRWKNSPFHFPALVNLSHFKSMGAGAGPVVANQMSLGAGS